MKQHAESAAGQTVRNLHKVLAVTAKINSSLDLDELLGIIMSTASDVMHTQTASLMLIEPASNDLVFKVALGDKGSELIEKFRIKMGEGIAGHVAQTGEAVIVNDTQHDARFASRFDESTGFQTKAILCVPLKNKDKVIGVIQAINPLTRHEFSNDDLELFSIFADQAAISLENARMHKELIQQEKARQELRIAHEIQQKFLPDIRSLKLKMDISAESLPARSVGGDLYDIVRLPDQKIAVILGDVSGKGVPAALYMVQALSAFRFLIPTTTQPAELLNHLNRILIQHSHFGMFLTLLYLFIDPVSGLVEYASAGHQAALLKNANSGEVTALKDNAGIPLGMLEGTVYEQTQVRLSKKDLLFLYTDGITEARNSKGSEFGLKNLYQMLGENWKDADECSQSVFSRLKVFTQGAVQHDDMTALTIIL
ncbi:MAG: SpoIIE family protein phosphatase [Candidatus Omnitrophica bacterium]|nr:SpoIIE family protein phosphatase [Candidatus Omnitrophota bacterium]